EAVTLRGGVVGHRAPATALRRFRARVKQIADAEQVEQRSVDNGNVERKGGGDRALQRAERPAHIGNEGQERTIGANIDRVEAAYRLKAKEQRLRGSLPQRRISGLVVNVQNPAPVPMVGEIADTLGGTKDLLLRSRLDQGPGQRPQVGQQ